MHTQRKSIHRRPNDYLLFEILPSFQHNQAAALKSMLLGGFKIPMWRISAWGFNVLPSGPRQGLSRHPGRQHICILAIRFKLKQTSSSVDGVSVVLLFAGDLWFSRY
jgi:hypothetical protein